MCTKKKIFTIFAILFCLNFNINNTVFAQEIAKSTSRYPDFAYEFMGNDKFENFNRKMFVFNTKLNKYAIRPVHIIWASVMPKYGMDRIQSAYTNIEYPKRLVSSLMQKDFKTSGKETLRFVTNTTIGLGGLYDPAKSYFKLQPAQEDMEQALCKCKVKEGPYLVIPVITSTSPRDLVGKVLDTALNPSSYVASPVLAIVKAGLTVNRTSYMQSMFKMVESTYADPYDIAKKVYCIDKYIKTANLDRKEVLDTNINIYDNIDTVNKNSDNIALSDSDTSIIKENTEKASEKELNIKSATVGNQTEAEFVENNKDKLTVNDIIQGGANVDNIILKNYNLNNSRLIADMMLFDYNPQNPITDSMRTALFDLPGINNSIWTDLSIWNRSFSKRIRTSHVNIDPTRDNYKFKYIMQKDKNAPVAIVYPSIGEGITSYHSVVLAKLFYDEGYSVIIQGSHFQWEFVKSMPKDYKPGIPSQDADYLKIVTSKIINSLQKKYDCQFREKVVIGTSFGALTTLFLADKESQNNTMNITKYISINPPIELIYAMKQVDKNNEEWNKNPADIKNRVAITAAKVLQTYQLRESFDKKIGSLPFSEDEAKLITCFIMHQKLSDLIFTLEESSKSKKTDIYKSLNNTSYHDYMEKYLLNDEYKVHDDLNYVTSLYSIANYLQNNNNYRIYHTLDDYLVNQQQLKQLKKYSGNKTVLISNGSHLGFLYRQEFIDELRKDISLKPETMAHKAQ